MSKELRNIITETKKQLEHLRVLGVDGIQVTAGPATVVERLKPVAAPRAEPIKPPAPIENVPRADPISLDDKSASVKIRIFAERGLFPLGDEHFIAGVPGA